jgi:hypothetical protein
VVPYPAHEFGYPGCGMTVFATAVGRFVAGLHQRACTSGPAPAGLHQRACTSGPAPAGLHQRACTGGPAPAGNAAAHDHASRMADPRGSERPFVTHDHARGDVVRAGSPRRTHPAANRASGRSHSNARPPTERVGGATRTPGPRVRRHVGPIEAGNVPPTADRVPRGEADGHAPPTGRRCARACVQGYGKCPRRSG